MSDTPPLDTAAHNAAVIQKVISQDAAGQSTAANPAGDAGDALDALAAQVKPKEEGQPPVVDPAKAKADLTPPAAPDPAAEAKAAELAKAAEAAKTAEAAARQVLPGEDPFRDLPGLPQGASPKSSEAFAAVKLRATQEIAAREQKIAEAQAELTKLKATVEQPTPEQLAKEEELKGLREWRAKLDVEFDPKFKRFDNDANQAREFIYAQLRKSPAITEAVIAEIKKHGGPDFVDLTAVFAATKDPVLQRLVEAKVADIEMAKYNKEQQIKAAKDNIGGYLQERQKALQGNVSAHLTQTTQRLEGLTKELEWLKEDPKNPDHNKFVAQTREQMQAALQDPSPEMHAILITGMAQLFNLQRVDAQKTTRISELEKQLADVTGRYEKIKVAGRSRLEESNAPAAGRPVAPKASDQFTQKAGDAVDALARQILEKRAQANSGA